MKISHLETTPPITDPLKHSRIKWRAALALCPCSCTWSCCMPTKPSPSRRLNFYLGLLSPNAVYVRSDQTQNRCYGSFMRLHHRRTPAVVELVIIIRSTTRRMSLQPKVSGTSSREGFDIISHAVEHISSGFSLILFLFWCCCTCVLLRMCLVLVERKRDTLLCRRALGTTRHKRFVIQSVVLI